jgi:hypothetical protein
MATAAQVTQAYFDLLGRPPDPAGLAYYTTGEGAARGIDQIRADFQYATDIGAESPALVNQSDVNQFNTLVASGDYQEAAQFAAAKGVDPAITADYINQNAPNLNLDADFRINAGDVSSLTRDDVSSAYENILGRAPDQEGLDFYTDPANLSTGAGLTGLPALQALLADSPEGRARDLLNRTYQTTLNRDPDQKAYDFYLPQIISGDLNADNLVSAVTGGAASGPDQQAAINFALQKNLGEFDRLVAAGDFTGAKGILDQSINQYYLDPNASYANIAEYLNTDPKFAGIRDANKGALFTPENVRSFGEEKRINAGMDQPVDNNLPYTQAVVTDAQGNIISGPPDKVISGIPRFAAQTPSAVTFAPLRRGLAQLRPAAFMPGLTSGQAPLGGSGFTPEQLRQASTRITQEGEAAGKTQEQILADFASLMDVGGVSPAELASATGRAPGELQAEYNQLRPGGLFGTAAPAPRGLPEDFALQTGAYGAATPTFLARPDPAPTPTTDGRAGGVIKDNKIIKMAEGGEPPKMSKLSAAEAGSTFDIADYIDEQGRLVGGFSRPVYDENRVITGYDYRPYERDVVFGEELREKEERERMRNMAEGGLANVAQNLADRGRKGDSMLVHMAPEEVAGLRALARAQGTDMTINPRTGLPEAFSLKKLFKAASFILPFVPIPGLFGMSSLLTKSIMSGIAAGASAKGGFDFKQALGGGLSAYALGSLGEKMSGAATPGGTPTTPPTTVSPELGGVNTAAAPTITTPSGDVSLVSSFTGPGATPVGPQSLSADLTAPLKVGSNYTDVAAAPIDAYTLRGGPQTGEAFYNKFPSDAVPVTGGSLPPGADTVPGRAASVITPKGEGFGPAPLTKGTDIALAGLGGLSLQESAKEQRSYEIEAAALKREEEERRRRFEDLAYRTLGRVNVKSGGQINLANGGMTYMEAGGTTGPTGVPRDVTGTGDGMSDSVPATIEGVQEARLADGEFVIPADVVADIGNGSSDAGSKKLYDMMDRIRKARHGTTKQPPEIRAERLMPA